MKFIQRVSVVLVFMFAVTSFGLAAAADKCPLCGMPTAGNENTAFVVTMQTGEEVTYCCAHCGLWAITKEKGKAKSAKTRDFISGEWIDATKALYLYKSKATPACSPSWISFGSKKDIQMFRKGFGGKIYSYEQALKARASQPEGMEMR